jgi:NAD(P)-dependent dehydrogenase (short-subunit alcohol dehydrogenase family)
VSVEGKNIVVTGATRGIGKVTAVHLAELGAHITVVGRNVERAEKVVASIVTSGGSAEFVRCDLSIEDDVVSLFDEVRRRRGRVDVVVSNAAATEVATRDHPIVEQSTEDFDYFVRANLYSVFWCFKYGIPAMQPEGGAFVTISSMEAIMARSGEPSYATTKTAVDALTRQVAVDYGDKGIRANTLMLGLIETNATAPFMRDARIGPIIRNATGGRPPTSLDVAHAVAFLASDAAGGFNGATLVLDRGMTVFGHVPGDLTLGL